MIFRIEFSGRPKASNATSNNMFCLTSINANLIFQNGVPRTAPILPTRTLSWTSIKLTVAQAASAHQYESKQVTPTPLGHSLRNGAGLPYKDLPRATSNRPSGAQARTCHNRSHTIRITSTTASSEVQNYSTNYNVFQSTRQVSTDTPISVGTPRNKLPQKLTTVTLPS